MCCSPWSFSTWRWCCCCAGQGRCRRASSEWLARWGVVCSHPAALVAGGASLVVLAVYMGRRDWARGGMGGCRDLDLAQHLHGRVLPDTPRARHQPSLAWVLAGRVPTPTAGAGIAAGLAWRGIAAGPGQQRRAFATRVAAAACLAGVLAVGRRRVALAALVLAPLPLVVAAAAAARKYPLDGRLTLFLVPTVLLLLAASVDVLAAETRGWGRVGALAGVVLVAGVAAQPVTRTLRTVPHPINVTETLPLLEVVRTQWKPGDRIAVETSAEPSYRYYAARLGLDPAPVAVALRTRPCGGPPVARQLLTAKRVWFLLSVWPHSSFAPTALGPPLVADAQPQEQADLAQFQLAAHVLRVERPLGPPSGSSR